MGYIPRKAVKQVKFSEASQLLKMAVAVTLQTVRNEFCLRCEVSVNIGKGVW